MSRQNLELARAFAEAFNARDVEAIVAICHPEIEFHSTFAAVGAEVYFGHGGVRRWHRAVEETWTDVVRAEPEAHFDLGDAILTFAIVHARGRQSGVQVAIPGAYFGRIREGLIVYFKGYARREEALTELGVSEGALEPIAPERAAAHPRTSRSQGSVAS